MSMRKSWTERAQSTPMIQDRLNTSVVRRLLGLSRCGPILSPFLSSVGFPGRDEVLMFSFAERHFNINPVARQDSRQFAHWVKGGFRSVKGVNSSSGVSN